MADERKIAHLEMVQGVIDRIGNNSFMIKGWAVTLVSAIFALSIENHKFSFIALFPILLFWWLDAFFLYQERLFRRLYNDVALKDDASITYSMNNVSYKKNSDKICKAALSKTLLCFYGGMLLVLIVLLVIHYLNLECVTLWLHNLRIFCF
jgi:hypothetical protein